jgi:hypothetical protein
VHARRPFSLFCSVLAALVVVSLAGAAVERSASVRFSFLPQKAFQGQPAALAVAVRPSGVRCAGAVRYADGRSQSLGSVVARSGKAAWRWTLPGSARVGLATASVTCGKAGRISRTFAVSGPPAAPARVVVQKNGFSQRLRFNSREVSYGLVLANPSPEKDALDVSVLINFVDATNRVVKTETPSVAAVGAGAQYFLGGSTTIPDASPVSKLEIVTRIGSQAPKSIHYAPTADVQVLQSLYDLGFVGAVQGQVRNDLSAFALSSAQVSAVIFDPAGEVIGGGTGYVRGTLLPGVRAYFQASLGLSAVPIDRAATAGVSVSGRYERTS